VETLVTGDIKQLGDKLIINVRLINAGDDSQIWGNQYVRTSSDVIATQNEIAQAVAQNLLVKLTETEQQQLKKRYTQNVEAYQLYLKGRFHALKLTPPELQTGISYFQQAIEIDQSYALAYVGLADAYRSISIVGEIPSTEYLPKSKATAQRAIELDDTLAEAHASLGFTLFRYDWNWNEAEKQCRRALELDPNSADAHQVYAHLLSNTGHHTESLAEIKRARELDPLNLRINALEAQFMIYAGQTDAALDRLQKTLELDRNYYIAHMFASSAYIEKRMFAEAIVEARQARELSGVSSLPTAFLGYALAKSDKQAEARTVLEELLKLSNGQYVSPYNIAMIFNGLNERDKTLDWLEKGLEKRDVRMTYLKVEPKWNNLHDDPRFQDLLRRIGLS
jgi:tetratricopeptide (TPR) repeat protein